jgi:E3 ubiquitin-protein ligase TRIP12
LELLQDTIAGSGIRQQIDAFKEGFNELFAIDDLKLLTCPELVALFGKSKEDWSYSTLADAIKADHGFTMESQAIKYLLQVLSEFSPEERRQFLQFTTGSPRLPIGGWKVLRPVFTVVRKVPEAPMVSDDYLPSVMTCANYLKMPEYSSKEAMHEKLVKSMTEGQNSFLLS